MRAQSSGPPATERGVKNLGGRRFGAIVLALAAIVVLAQTSTGKSALSSIGLYAPSQPYTELYFGSTATIALATRGELTQTASARLPFVIVNRTHRRRVYHWSITSLGVVRAAGSAAIAPAATRWTSAQIATGCAAPRSTNRRLHSRGTSPERVRISVALSSPAQAIDYWLVCRG